MEILLQIHFIMKRNMLEYIYSLTIQPENAF